MLKAILNLTATPARLRSTLPAPEKPKHIPAACQWLAGEGAGSWFYAVYEAPAYTIRRYAPDGRPECAGLFELQGQKHPDLGRAFSFIHLSHCKTVRLEQDGTNYLLQRIQILELK